MDRCIEFSIQLESSQLVYYPEQNVSGRVVLGFKEPTEVQRLLLTFRGEGFTSWTEKDGRGDNCHLREFTERKYFVSESRCLLGSARSTDENQVHVPAVVRSHEFSFRLPSNSPSSFEGTFGHIRYELEATLESPSKEEEPLKTKRIFTVNEIIDANCEEYTKDVSREYSPNPSCLSFATVPVQFYINLKRRCYCPGESILINAYVENHSKRDLKSVTAYLTQITTYRVNLREKTKVINKDIVTLTGPSIPKGKTFEWNNEPMGIVATEPTIANCSVISVQYVLRVIVGVSIVTNPTVQLPIIIGTIPSVGYDQVANDKTSPITDFEGCEEYSPLLPSKFGHSNMAPPSYTAVGTTRDRKTSESHIPVYTFAKTY